MHKKGIPDVKKCLDTCLKKVEKNLSNYMEYPSEYSEVMGSIESSLETLSNL